MFLPMTLRPASANASQSVPSGQIQPQKPRLKSSETASAPMMMTRPAGRSGVPSAAAEHPKEAGEVPDRQQSGGRLWTPDVRARCPASTRQNA